MILNGAFGKWLAEGKAVSSGDTPCAWSRKARPTTATLDDFSYEYNSKNLKLYEDIIKLQANSDNTTIIDSRFEAIYSQGNIPASLNIPFTSVINADKTFKSAAELMKIF